MPRYKIIIEYNGYNYYGWQKQPGYQAVQGIMEQALYDFSQQKINVYGACRTDAGVHAKAQVAHFDLEKCYSDYTIFNALNFYLKQENISVVAIEKVAVDFHARFDTYNRLQHLVLQTHDGFAANQTARARISQLPTSVSQS